MTTSRNTSTMPQGFSVYQPALGQQLQFFPAVGTQELDAMVNAFVPGPASIQEKRATISLDFLEYSQVTGQAFKFYPVYSLGAASSSFADSPVAASPLQDSSVGSSSFNVSPVTPTWDFSHISHTASSSRRSSSAQAARGSSSRRAGSSPSTTDFSSLPGMKIMTKDGLDVTNSASRGSKTKEQRDHAHLMRIIKACESCKKKKIRCDPSHKRRAAAAAAASGASQPVAKASSSSSKKAKAVSQPRPVAPVVEETASPAVAVASYFEPAVWDGLDSFTTAPEPAMEPWEEFVDYSSGLYSFEDMEPEYDFFFDPDGHLSPQTATSTSLASSASSPFKAFTPSSQQDGVYASASLSSSGGVLNPELQAMAELPAFVGGDVCDGVAAYEDFTLFSPSSSFSEDERMLEVSSSTSPTELSEYSEQSTGYSDESSALVLRSSIRRGVLQTPEQRVPGDGRPPSDPSPSPDGLSSLSGARPLSAAKVRTVAAGDSAVLLDGGLFRQQQQPASASMRSLRTLPSTELVRLAAQLSWGGLGLTASPMDGLESFVLSDAQTRPIRHAVRRTLVPQASAAIPDALSESIIQSSALDDGLQVSSTSVTTSAVAQTVEVPSASSSGTDRRGVSVNSRLDIDNVARATTLAASRPDRASGQRVRFRPERAVPSAQSSGSGEVLTTDVQRAFSAYEPWVSFAPVMSLATATILAVQTWTTLAVLQAQMCVASLLCSDAAVASLVKSALRNSTPSSARTDRNSNKNTITDGTTGTEGALSDTIRPAMMQRRVACI